MQFPMATVKKNALYRIRIILLEKKPDILNSKVNTEEKVIEK
jgi:hypothetical protein